MLKQSRDDGSCRRCIRIVIADRQPIVLQGLISIFATQHDFEIVASCSDGTSFLAAVRNFAPDVALLSDSLPRLTVSEILAVAKTENLATRLVFFTDYENDNDLASAIAAGVCGAISRSENPGAVLGSLRMMAERVASPEQLPDQSPIGKESDSAKLEKLLGLLTQREREIVRLVSGGLSNKQIARQLNLSPGTVKVHLRNIFQKLAVNNRTVLATIALLQRSAGFGTLLLAALAFAVLDDAEASSKNDSFEDDDSTAWNADAGLEHSEFKLKKAIIQHTVDAGEKILVSPRGHAAEASQEASSAARAESFEAAQQTAPSILHRNDGLIGSSTPPSSIPPSLLAITNGQIASPMAQQQFPLLPSGSNPMKGLGGSGIFTMLTGAWIYALESTHASAHPLGSGEVLAGTSMVVTGDSAAKVATTAVHREFTSWANTINLAAFGTLAVLHLTSASHSVPPHTLAWMYNPASNETIVYVNSTDRSLNIGDAGLQEIHVQGFVSTADLASIFGSEATAVAAALEGIDATSVAKDADLLTTNTADASIQTGLNEGTDGAAGVWSMPADNGFRFHFERDRSGSDVSARQIGLSDDSAAAQQESDDAASASLHVSSIGLTGTKITSIFEENVTSKNETLNTNNSGLSTEHGKAPATAGPAFFEFAALGAVTGPTEPTAAPGNSAEHRNSQHASEAASETAAVTEPTEPVAAPGNSAEHRNSQHASEAASETAAATEPTEPAAAPGNSAEHRNSQHASEAAAETAAATAPTEPAAAPGNSAEHRNSQHASEAASETAAATEPTEPAAAPGNSAEHRNSQHASEAASETAAASEPTEPAAAPGNSAEHRNSQHASEAASETAAATAPTEPGAAPGNSAEHGNSQHASEAASETAAATAPIEPGAAVRPLDSGSASSMATANPIETNVDLSNGAGQGISQHVPHSAANNAPDATQPPAATSEAGSADQELVFRFDSQPTPSPLTAVVELTATNDPPVLLDPDVGFGAPLKVSPPALQEHAVGHDNNAQPHATAHSPHDLLI
ncbi:response regulator transcription factor [Bradyrhizobium sp. WSM3983]|uniref:response regulator transcription factor n=1 Tax=Bradyrhizobium sp. WSM3983 TaxID=1038867 RepID=UPI000685FA28|nr:response regulator transcription factor [Bradyrhizobium sp. WSM3983]